ncbi:MAG TPA: PDZ domain-containing protein [Nitrososphaeria archaeon]|nr:PDZ domain-containing protein [Nitrososphaeria archaeon]
MKGLYAIAAVSLAISLLAAFGLVIIHYRLMNMDSELSAISSEISKLESRVIKLGESLSELTSNRSQQVIVVKENITAPERVYELVKDSVVMIKAVSVVTTFFGKSYQHVEGSGFIYDKEGHIVTNYHVVSGAVKIEVYFPDKSMYVAKLIGADSYLDIAVLKIDPGDRVLKPLTLGNSSELKVGQPIIAVGNPFGFRGTLTTGVISQLGRLLETGSGRPIPDLIQIDAAINPGNSGGPLLDYSGKVVGITNAIWSKTGEFAGIGFAIPSNIVSKVVNSIITTGRYDHPWIGISGIDVNPEIAGLMNLSKPAGFLVIYVNPGSPADKAGIRGGTKTVRLSSGLEIKIGGDVIVGIDGVKVLGLGDILAYLEEKLRPGDKTSLTIIRDGREMAVEIVVGKLPT